MRSRRWLAGAAAGITLAALRPGTVSLAQEPVACPPAEDNPVTMVHEPAPSACGAPDPPAPPVTNQEPEVTAPEPPAPETPPVVEVAPDPVGPAAAPAPEAPAPQPGPPADAVAATAEPYVAVTRPPVAVTSPGRPPKARSHKPAARRSVVVRDRKPAKRDRPVAAPAPGAPSTVSIDWNAIGPLDLPAFGSEVASTFPGPSFLLPIYQAAAAQFGVPWYVLAAINEIETNFGENLNVSSAGAVGWMQFMPSTWKRWGVDANGDGHRDPHDPVDAIFSAARYLRAAGAEDDLARAIFAYNHAGWYVQDVTKRAVRFGSIPSDVLAALTRRGRREAKAIERATGSRGLLDPHATVDGIGRVILMTDKRLRRHVLRSERVHIYECGRQDIARGIVGRRVLETLMFLAYRDLEPTVSSLRCGHGYYTAGGGVSHHSYGDAVDIAAINGTPVLGHQGKGSITDEAVRELLELGGASRPDQIITLMAYTGAANALAMGDHDDHIHVGFRPARPITDQGPNAPRTRRLGPPFRAR